MELGHVALTVRLPVQIVRLSAERVVPKWSQAKLGHGLTPFRQAGNGLVRFKYQDNIGFLLTLFGGHSLHLFNVSGCGGLINSGDALIFRAGFALGTSKGDHVTSIASP